MTEGGRKLLRGCGLARLGGEILAGLRPRATRGNFAGSRPRTPRSFCFGKRTQNHGRPGVALRGPLPRSRKVRAAELASLKQSSPLNRVRDRGAATPAGALRWRHGMARGIHAKNPGSSITNVEDCKCSVIPFDRLRTGVDRMRGCPQEGNQERRAVVFLPFPSFSSPL